VYCCPDHLRLATNARIMERYHESKANRNGKARVCSTPGCATLLSRYNDEKVCAKCLAEHEAAERRRMLEIYRNSSDDIE
jgi:hypothetical protein